MENQNQTQANRTKLNGNKSTAAANMEMSPEGIQSYVQETIKEMTASLTDATSGLREYTQTKYDDSIDYVKKNPGKAVLGGVGLGFVLGAAFTAILSRKN